MVLVIGLMMGLLLPAVGAGGGFKLRQQGQRLAGLFELARQEAVVTGRAHRVVIDLEQGDYWLEKELYGAEEDEEPIADFDPFDPSSPLDLAPPAEAVLEFSPIRNQFGAVRRLDDGFFFEGVETAEGWSEEGIVYLIFEGDGSADAAQLIFSDPDQRSLVIDIAPMLDTVRMYEEEG